MNKDILRFNIQATFVAVILCVLGYLAFMTWFPKLYFSGFMGVILFLLLSTNLFHYLLISAITLRPASFVNRFIALTGGRLLFYLLVILVYLVLVKYQPVSFVITFICGYLVFTIFEVAAILNFLKKNSTKSGSVNQ
jgi:hypothetical protein